MTGKESHRSLLQRLQDTVSLNPRRSRTNCLIASLACICPGNLKGKNRNPDVETWIPILTSPFPSDYQVKGLGKIVCKLISGFVSSLLCMPFSSFLPFWLPQDGPLWAALVDLFFECLVQNHRPQKASWVQSILLITAVKWIISTLSGINSPFILFLALWAESLGMDSKFLLQGGSHKDGLYLSKCQWVTVFSHASNLSPGCWQLRLALLRWSEKPLQCSCLEGVSFPTCCNEWPKRTKRKLCGLLWD